MTGPSGWTPPGSGAPPGWSRRQPPPYAGGWPGGGAPGPAGAPPPRPGPAEPKRGIIALRPLGLGEILDGAITYIRQNPRATLGLAAIITTVSTCVQLLTQFAVLGEAVDIAQSGAAVEFEVAIDLLSGTLTVAAVAAVVGFLAQLVLTGMLTAAVGRAVLGRRARIGDVWRDVRPRLLPLFGLAALLTLIFLALLALVIGPVAALVAADVALAVTIPAGLVLGAAAVAAAVWLYVGFALATPALVLEHASVVAALRRSWTLVHRGFWRVLGILVLTGLIASLLAVVLQMPFAIPQQILMVVDPDPSSWTFRAALTIGALGAIVAGTVVAPFSAGVRALLYVDQRMRREGLDIALHSATGTPESSEPQAASPWLATPGAAPPARPPTSPPAPPTPPGGAWPS